MDVKKCTVCNIIIDINNRKTIEIYVRTVTILLEKNIKIPRSLEMIVIKKTFVNSVNNKQTKVVDSVNNTNRTFIIGFSNCGKTYLMNHWLQQNKNHFLKLQNQ